MARRKPDKAVRLDPKGYKVRKATFGRWLDIQLGPGRGQFGAMPYGLRRALRRGYRYFTG